MAIRSKGSTALTGDEAATPAKGRTPKHSKVERECECGCGALTTNHFKPGHDQKLRGQLLKAARQGEAEARAELLRRGWATDESIDAQSAKASAADVAARRRVKLEAKLVRARAVVAELEARLSEQVVAS